MESHPHCICYRIVIFSGISYIRKKLFDLRSQILDFAESIYIIFELLLIFGF